MVHLGWIHSDGFLAVDTAWPGSAKEVAVDSFLHSADAVPTAARNISDFLAPYPVETITVRLNFPDPTMSIRNSLRSHLSGYNVKFT